MSWVLTKYFLFQFIDKLEITALIVCFWEWILVHNWFRGAYVMIGRDTFVDGDVGVTQSDSEESISGGLVESAFASNTSDGDDFLLVEFGEVDGGHDGNNILNSTVSIDDDSFVLFDVDKSGCSDEFHEFFVCYYTSIFDFSF